MFLPPFEVTFHLLPSSPQVHSLSFAQLYHDQEIGNKSVLRYAEPAQQMQQHLHVTRNSADGPASPIKYQMMTLGCVNRPDQSASNDHPTEAGSERESASVFFETTYVTSISGIQSAPLASAVGRPVEKIRSKLDREVGQTHIADLSKRSECSLNLRMSGSAPRCFPACIVTSFSFPVYGVGQELTRELNS